MSGVEPERRLGLFLVRRGENLLNLSKLLRRAPERSCFTDTDEFFSPHPAHEHSVARIKAEDRAEAACGEIQDCENHSSGVLSLQPHD